MRVLTCCFLALLIFACGKEEQISTHQGKIRFEKIKYFTYPVDSGSKPFQYRINYYFDNGKPHRWLKLDSMNKVLTDYIYDYDEDWGHVGAKYREGGAREYAQEQVRFENDSTQITEWVDSVGNVFYTMTDYLNRDGKTYRAVFEGDEVHGFDSTFYTSEGFTRRIFFTSTKGEILNDRTFEYDSVNTFGDWMIRRKIMEDTIREWQIREVYYDDDFVADDGVYYPGVLSTGELFENTFSFSRDEKLIFQTRTADWDHQFGFIAAQENGLFTESVLLDALDTIYNGAISPDGTRILYCTKNESSNQIWLLEKVNSKWAEPVNVSMTSKIEGGYFHWLSDDELFFYIPDNNGDIVQGSLENGRLKVTNTLATINTTSATEFSPYVDQDKRFIIFTRYLEGDLTQQGFFISYNRTDADAPKWSPPEKLAMLPYGWNAYIINDGSQFIYSDGENIIGVPTANLKLKIKD